MKENAAATKLLMAAVCLAVLAYFGLQGYRYVADPLTTTVAYNYQVEKGASVTGWVVRQEQVLPDSGGLLSLSRAEGEKVSAGGTVAVIYADEASQQRQMEINTLETRIAQLEYAMDSALNREATLKLDSQIGSTILKLRTQVAEDQLAASDATVSNLRSLVLKRDYSNSNGSDLETELANLKTERKALLAQSASAAKAVKAPAAGIYSAVVDGYESVLTPEALTGITPSALSGVAAGSEESRVGKLILGDTWYYAATMNTADAEELRVGDQVTLRFAKSAGRDLAVTVDSISAAENSRVAVVFSSRQYLSELTLMRRQSAEIITDTVEGIRLPAAAIRVDDSGVTGVYCVVGMEARFKPVQVVYTGTDGYVLARAVDMEGRTQLRPGDEVIVSAQELTDGAVVS